MTDVTRILSTIEQGDSHAADQLLPLIYDELRKLAASKLAQEKPGQTLQATALVHEAYVRLVGSGKSPGQEQRWNSRGYFFAAAAEAMRRPAPEARRLRCLAKDRCRAGSANWGTARGAGGNSSRLSVGANPGAGPAIRAKVIKRESVAPESPKACWR